MLDISLTISLEKMCNKTTWKLCNAWQTQYLFTPPSCLVFPLPCNPGTFGSLARALISGTKSPPHQILPFRFLRGHLPVNVAQCFGKNSYQVSEYWRTQIRLQRQRWLVFSWKKFQLSYFSLNLKEPGSLVFCFFLFLFFFSDLQGSSVNAQCSFFSRSFLAEAKLELSMALGKQSIFYPCEVLEVMV